MADLTNLLAKIERRLKRKRKPPSVRDEEIYCAVRVCGCSQADAAIQFGISPGRVWQVVRRVESYRADHEPQDDSRADELHPSTRKQLDWQRLEQVIAMAMHDARRAEKGLYSQRERHCGPGGAISESIRRPMLGTGSLRVVLRAIELQWQLEQKPPYNQEQGRGERDFEHLVMGLVWLREQALGVRRGDQSARDDVSRWLRALVEDRSQGEIPALCAGMPTLHTDSPLMGQKASDGRAVEVAETIALTANSQDASNCMAMPCDNDVSHKSPHISPEAGQIASEIASPSAGEPISDDEYVLTIPAGMRPSTPADGTKSAHAS
jgi:hypothetical protein